MSQFDELPEGWEEARIEEIAQKVGSGATPRGGSKAYKQSGIPLIRSMNVHFDGLHEEGIVYLDDQQADGLKNVEVKANDVLLNITGASIGRVTQAPAKMEGARVNQHVCIIRPTENFDPAFLTKYLTSPKVQRVITAEEYGMTRQALTKQMILDFEIPLPPLNEQRRIVEKIEALTARSRKAREALEAIPELLDQFRQSVLAAAFRGDLTADWREQNPDVEPAEAFSGFEKNEIGWAVGQAQDACYKVQSGSTPKGKPFTEEGEVPFLKVYNIVNQEIDFDYKPQYVSREVHETKLKRSITLPGDVLMNIVGPPLGKVALVTEQFSEWNINQAIVTFRPKSGLINKYLYYYLCEGSLVRHVVNETKGIVGQVNISLTQCRESIVHIPSVKEQAEIVYQIEGFFSLASSLKQGLQESFEELGDLDQSILAKAFRGDLVPQDPNDESAAVLLDRIRAEREKLGKTKKSRRKTKT